VTAVTACKLIFIRAEKIQKVRQVYPELALRLLRCSAMSGKTKGKNFAEALEAADMHGVGSKLTSKLPVRVMYCIDLF
jgi:hypothetical protein